METKPISFEDLPEAVGRLINEVSEVRKLISESQTNTKTSNKVPIGIDEVCILTGKVKSTIYSLVYKRSIPCYKKGKKLYFYEDEILEWINSGKRLSNSELKDYVENLRNQE